MFSFYNTGSSVAALIGYTLISRLFFTEVITARLIFVWIYFRRCKNGHISLEFFFVDRESFIISRGLTLAIAQYVLLSSYLIPYFNFEERTTHCKIIVICNQSKYNRYQQCKLHTKLIDNICKNCACIHFCGKRIWQISRRQIFADLHKIRNPRKAISKKINVLKVILMLIIILRLTKACKALFCNAKV